jgi:tRNA dimethylallyltransferase
MMITILGPTATGKTKLAASLSFLYDGEIISADSRQVYKGMDIGTGKDLEDYYIHDTLIPYHLIDIAEPGQEYNVYSFQKDFVKAYNQIAGKGKTPVLCGGTGLYLDAVLKGYRLLEVPENLSLRQNLLQKSDEELREMLREMRPHMHNTTDITERSRIIRALEIETYYQAHPDTPHYFPKTNPVVIGIHYERGMMRQRITERLQARLKGGMVEEIHYLLATGLPPEQLKFYGLEYKYVTAYVTGELEYSEMFSQLNTAIHQFAKRQVTWFRRMQKKGTVIHWIDGTLSMPDKLTEAKKIIAPYLDKTS